MKKILRVVAIVFAAVQLSPLLAQPGCPAVNAGNDVVIPCGQTCTTLNASAFSAAETNTYSVSSIPYNPPFGFNVGNSILVAIDDTWGGVINLPFNFCFFGNVYSQIVVGSNGVISFNVANANGFNSYAIPGGIPRATPADLLNCIMGPWQDIDPTNQGQIRYQISGTYPCRSFEVSWFQVPYYGDPNSVSTNSCNSPLFATNQIVLYETTNAIEVYIQQKQTCPGWNGGLAIEGIQNAAGTVAFTVPGRNATQWNANNDAWRFTPAGNSNTTIAWFDGATQIGTGSSVQVCPTTSKSYTAQAVYTNCDASTTTVTDNVFVGISGISVQTDSIRNPSCNGGSNGAAFASFTSTGSAVLSYGWSPGGVPNQTSILNIPAGTYIFSVTDATNCTRYDTVTLIDPAPMVVVVPDSNAYSCTPGVVFGSLVANAAGGDTTGGNYSYLWTNTAITQSITGLTAGCYTVTVSDMHGCTASDQGCVIANIAPPVFNAPLITDVSCNGGSDGSITVSLGQAVPPFTYTWSGGLPSGPIVTGLLPGTYFVTGTDVNGCSATTSYTVDEPTLVTLGTPSLTQANCTDGGSICVTATGGSGTFVYTWSNGETGSCIDSLAAGPYDLTVTDQNLCSITATYTVTSIAGVVSFGNPTIVDVACGGQNTGSITATATGGTGNIAFVWSNQVNGAVNSNLLGGAYSVTITDAANCTASTTYTVNEPTAIVIGTPIITQATCQSGGSISVTAAGGTGTLIYSWSNNESGTLVDSLAAGPYDLTVTDQNGCTASASFIVPADPSVVIFGAPIIVSATCNGDSTGSITATATGGTGVIQFFWSYNNTNSATISGVPGGAYSVTITDQNNCSASTTYNVSQPTAIVPVISFTSLICLNTTGSGTVSATGGTPGYTYHWNNQSDSSYTDNLFPGNISVTVTDAIGCSVSVSGNIQVAPDIIATSIVRPFPCVDPPYGNDTIIATGGAGALTYILVGVDTNSAGIFNNLPPGSYTFIIQDTLGCSKSNVFTIPQSAADDEFAVVPNATTCFSFTDGAITLTALSANGPYSYSLNGGSFQSSNTFNDLGAGTYTIVAQNTYGCQFTLSGVVDQPAQVFANATPDTIVTAPGVANGITVSTQNFINPVYTWTPVEGLSCTDCSNPTVSVNAATVFYVTVSELEVNNCAAFDSVVIIVTSGFKMPNAFTPNGDGKNDSYGPVSFGPITIKEFRVYNRWGELVHNALENWDGVFSGKEQPAGTYVYYIQVQTPDKDNPGSMKTDNKQGSFSLIR